LHMINIRTMENTEVANKEPLEALLDYLEALAGYYEDWEKPYLNYPVLNLNDQCVTVNKLRQVISDIKQLHHEIETLHDSINANRRLIKLLRRALETCVLQRDEARLSTARLYRAAEQAREAILDAQQRGLTMPLLRAAYDALDRATKKGE